MSECWVGWYVCRDSYACHLSTAINAKEITPGIGHFTALDTLRLDHNWLWNLPASMMGLPRLRVLSLNDNRLDKLPTEVYGWR